MTLKDHIKFRYEGGVYVRGGADSFEYSDGTEAEQHLKTVLEEAKDLSSHSVELERGIHDWPSEYHLSSKRANLLRGFKFEQGARVLELGCGCGAISRFLGEQGLEVDAVEGSLSRAQLASLRCRDLPNVSVYCENFNHLALPAESYDLICLVGVTEYAARFMDEPNNGAEPVVALLRKLRHALKPGGVVMVAIENRTGMKYVLGAHEDHYAKRFVGINNYFGIRDINTYTLAEWERIFDRSGVKSREVYLPFPDYKLPTVLLSQRFVNDNPWAYCNLEGTQSRDYVDTFRPGVRESLFWQSAAASNSLDLHANSFLFVLDMTGTGVESRYVLDFAHMPGFSRRRECCLLTVKPAGEEVVRRTKLVDTPFEHRGLEQRIVDEPYHSGTLLSVHWARALEIEPDTDRFVNLVKEYVLYLENRGGISIDLTPFNIVVAQDGTYRPFDEEWRTTGPVSVDFLVFRSLVVLATTAGASIRPYAEHCNLKTVGDFIVHVGEWVGMDMAREMASHVEAEERFQSAIAVDRQGNPTRALLKKSARNVIPVRMRLYWRHPGQPYAEERSQQALVDNWDDRQVVAMRLPPPSGASVGLRFNPAEKLGGDGSGFVRIYSMEVSAVDPETGERTPVWAMAGPDQIAHYATMTGLRYGSSSLGSVFVITEDDPGLDFRFIPREKLTEQHGLEFRVELRIPRSKDYLLARDLYLSTQERLERKLIELAGVEASQRRASEELADIKRSRFWRGVEAYRRVRARLNVPVEKALLWAALLKNLGWRRTASRAFRQGTKRIATAVGAKPASEGPPTRYEIWRDVHMSRSDQAPKSGPLISIVMPVHNAPGQILEKAIRSVRRQSYSNWELCIADDASREPETLAVLRRSRDSRIRITNLDEGRNISGATNAAVELACGEYLAFMDHDDEICEDALARVVETITETEADFLYTDEDFIRIDGHLDNPHFKPDYNPDLLLSHNYITHLVVMTSKLFHDIGKLRSDYDGAQDYDLVLRAVEQARRIAHVPRPLYHWRMSEQSTSVNPTVKPAGQDNARKALEDALRRRGITGTVEPTRLPHYFRVKRRVAGEPLVSIIIPFRDKPDMLGRCVAAILERSTYERFEIVGISNDSCSSATYDEMERLGCLDDRVTFHELNEAFNFSRLVNYGVDQCAGDHVLLLNNDIEVITPDWIQGLLEHSQRGEIAAVGGKLYYPDNRVQHAGIAIGLGGYAGHPHQGFRADSPGYFNRLNVIQNVTAVTGAMMMVEKRKYVEIGMFDEDSFGVAYNDVDFCLRAVESGFLNVFTPCVEAYHLESASRGYEDTPIKQVRFETEKARLRARHGAALDRGDPYYNPNFDRNRDDFRFVSESIFAKGA